MVHRGMFSVVVLCALSTSSYAQDRAAQVRAVRDRVIAAGIDLEHGPGECGRFEVVKRFAWEHRAEGFGLIAKFAGQNGCSATNTLDEPKYAVDAVILPDGRAWDVIGGGSEGPNTPHWLQIESHASLWRAPFDPDDSATAPAPPPSHHLDVRVEELEARLQNLTASLAMLQVEVDRVRARMAALEARPIPSECRVTILDGIPVSCRLVAP
jgi:hypothetical protein